MIPRRRTNPVMPATSFEDERTDVRIEFVRNRASELGNLVTAIQTEQANALRRIANIEMAQAETSRAVIDIREGQIGLGHVAKQILDEMHKDRETRKSNASEGGAWKRTLAQLLITAGALTVAIVTLALNKC